MRVVVVCASCGPRNGGQWILKKHLIAINVTSYEPQTTQKKKKIKKKAK